MGNREGKEERGGRIGAMRKQCISAIPVRIGGSCNVAVVGEVADLKRIV